MQGLNLDVYTPIGDTITIVMCTIYFFLLRSTYTVRKANLRLFVAANGLCIIAASSSILYHFLLFNIVSETVIAIYAANAITNLSLAFIFMIFNKYLSNLVNLPEDKSKKLSRLMWGVYLAYAVVVLVSPFTHFDMYIDENLMHHDIYYFNPFIFIYMIYGFISAYIIVVYKNHFITKVRHCLQSVMVISFVCVLMQAPMRQTSFTCITFTFPIVACLFLFHYNAYDIYTGTLDEKSFASYIEEFSNQKFSLISMSLKELTDEARDSMSEHFFHFNEQFFYDPCTFRMREDRMILVYPHKKNPNARAQYNKLLEEFDVLYQKYCIDYKLVFIDSVEEIRDADQYVRLCEVTESKMEWDSVCKVSEEDIKKYIHIEGIRKALKDINAKMDLDDERVLVYCQPVLNTKTGKFTTAEALMRLSLPDVGFVFPDEFIPLAEKIGCIHALSKIILHKTCKNLMRFEADGYNIERVSVNFSMIELRDPAFCDDLVKIISDTGLEPGKIAIELTESKNEKDFELVKNVMNTLQYLGIKFYLDDFGTGYSNFARIIGLPIDIIKFDRSLTIMSGQDDNSKYMVGSFSDIFKNSQYQILYEGVEDESDEQRCIDMNAQYLQGYKYSKPIPMEELENFLEKKV